MKKNFSGSWISSSQVRKQRKYRVNAPLHVRHKFLSSNLSKTLREKYGKRNLPLRKGDEVLVMRGSFKRKRAKITSIDLKRLKIALENIQRGKKDGTKVNVYFHPSSLQIVSLTLDDKKRIASIERSKKKEKPKASEKQKEEKKGEKKNASN
jgi:large subunit ribosomal protein L24